MRVLSRDQDGLAGDPANGCNHVCFSASFMLLYGFLDHFGQLSYGGRFEQPAQRNLYPEHAAHPRYDLGGQQRVPSDPEKVVVHPHPLHPQDLLPEPCHLLFHLVPRPNILRLPLSSRQSLPPPATHPPPPPPPPAPPPPRHPSPP